MIRSRILPPLEPRADAMKIAITKPLFAWDALEDSPSLQSLRLLLESIPDHPLLESLRAARGKGRDEYPVEVLWGTLVLAIALRHVSIDACLEELRRNPALRLLIGIEGEEKVPGPDNMSRFLATLGEEPHLAHLRRDLRCPGRPARRGRSATSAPTRPAIRRACPAARR